MVSTSKWAAALLGMLLILGGCSNMAPEKQAGAGSRDTGSWDADSRNNEDASLGAKSVQQPPAPGMKTPTLDSSIAHSNHQLTLSRDLADELTQHARTGSTAVAVTDKNIYVAVDLGGIQAMSAPERSFINGNDPAKGVGIFGSGSGAQIDWTSTKPLPKATSKAIMETFERSGQYAKHNVYISANPYFVARMMFYDEKQRAGADMSHYLYELNTMAQYAFPQYANGQNRLLQK